MKNVVRIDVAQAADGRYFAHVTLPSGKEVVTDDQRSVHLVFKRVETILERLGE